MSQTLQFLNRSIWISPLVWRPGSFLLSFAVPEATLTWTGVLWATLQRLYYICLLHHWEGSEVVTHCLFSPTAYGSPQESKIGAQLVLSLGKCLAKDSSPSFRAAQQSAKWEINQLWLPDFLFQCYHRQSSTGASLARSSWLWPSKELRHWWWPEFSHSPPHPMWSYGEGCRGARYIVCCLDILALGAYSFCSLYAVQVTQRSATVQKICPKVLQLCLWPHDFYDACSMLRLRKSNSTALNSLDGQNQTVSDCLC